jgi:hypothetical protein
MPVRLYVDQSGSMAGYLDREFGQQFGVAPGTSSLRAVVARLSSVGRTAAVPAVYGFGEKVTSVIARANQDVIAQLVERGFYRARDSRLEDVLDRIARDTARGDIHIILTDGRRDGGAAAIAQYRRLGMLARQWTTDTPTATPGMFALAAISAPFQPAGTSHAGCWSTPPQRLLHCPLYVFAFAPQAAAAELLPALRFLGTRLYVTPTLGDDSVRLRADQASVAASDAAGLHTFGGRTPADPLLLLYRATRPTGQSEATPTVLADVSRSLLRYAAGDSLIVVVSMAPLTGRAPQWDRVERSAEAWVRPRTPVADSTGSTIAIPIDLRARPQLSPTAYRIELASSGRPAWLDEYSSAQQGDATRTFGLASLFDYLTPAPSRLLGLYAGVY